MRLLCGDEERRVEVRESKHSLEVRVDDAAFTLAVDEVAPGAFLLRRDGRMRTFHCVRDGDEIHLFWDGVGYRLTELREGRRAAHRHGASGLEAPMPGKVIAVKARPGQAVAKGQELLIVEAMKMENAIRAPRDGRVKAVAARVGDMVSPGVVLVELEA